MRSVPYTEAARDAWSVPDVALALAIVSGAAGMVGVYLDTAWHRTVGRDSFFILPHVFIYCGGLGVWAARPSVTPTNSVAPSTGGGRSACRSASPSRPSGSS